MSLPVSTDALPQPRSLPLLGNLPDLDADKGVLAMMELADEYGPIFRLDLPGREIVVLSSQALVDEVCDESRFDKQVRAPLRHVRDFAGDGLFTAHTHEENWGRAHRILMPAFGRREPLLRQHRLGHGTVLANRELVDLSAPGARSKRHLEIALPEGETYRAGDYLAVLPVNPPAVVDSALRRFDLRADTTVLVRAPEGTRTFLPTDTPCPRDSCWPATSSSPHPPPAGRSSCWSATPPASCRSRRSCSCSAR